MAKLFVHGASRRASDLVQCHNDEVDSYYNEKAWLYMAKRFIEKYGTKLIVPIYMIIYMLAFQFLENRVNYRMHIIHSSLDRMIPFCEYFIIPYVLWFLYIACTVLWFMFKNDNETEYLQLIANLGIGMTVFIIISWIYPNGHFLRPMVFPRDNVFTDMVRFLYQIDTPTNILPSIHVYNSVAASIAIVRCQKLKSKPMIVGGSVILSALIIASTVFLKQHTIVDVAAAFILNLFVYLIVYLPADSRIWLRHRQYPRIEN